jgi:hypothetical protein
MFFPDYHFLFQEIMSVIPSLTMREMQGKDSISLTPLPGQPPRLQKTL